MCGARTVHRAWLREDCAAGAPLLAALHARSIPVVRAGREALAALVRSRGRLANEDHTQGVVVDASPLAVGHLLPATVATGGWPAAVATAAAAAAAAAAASAAVGLAPNALAPPSPPRLLLALDGVGDPHNVGAILRSAALLRADGVVLSAKGCAPLGPTVSRASAGALEVLAAEDALRYSAVLPALLTALRAAGWAVLGADAGGGTSGGADSGRSPTWLAADSLRRSRDTVLVLGSEGQGLRSAVRAACELLVCLPTDSPRCSVRGAAVVESLNVSTAAAVLLWLLRPHGSAGGALGLPT